MRFSETPLDLHTRCLPSLSVRDKAVSQMVAVIEVPFSVEPDSHNIWKAIGALRHVVTYESVPDSVIKIGIFSTRVLHHFRNLPTTVNMDAIADYWWRVAPEFQRFRRDTYAIEDGT